MSNFLKAIIRLGSKIESIRREAHYNVSPENAFKICNNFEEFLKVMLHGEGPGNLKWKKGGPGEVGAEVEYELTRNGMTNIIREEITKLDFDKNTGVYTLAWKNTYSNPWIPVEGYTSTWEIKPYKDTENDDKPHCHLVWTQEFRQPRLLGLIPITGTIKNSLNGTGSVITNFVMRQYYEQEFPSTGRRLPKKGERVAVIGAGPSGLHMAHLLKNKVGVEDITILERSDRFGGKTVTVDSETNYDKENEKGLRVVHELGTCYMHPAYFAVRAYMQELKEMMLKNGQDIPYGFAEEVEPIHYSINRTGKESLTLEGWVTANLQLQPRFSIMALFRIILPKTDTMLELKKAQIKYNRIHKQIFGAFDYSLPPRLTPENLAKIDMSFGQFLLKHGLSALSPILAYGNTAQGYGSIENVPAFWAMCWITPDLMDGYFRFPKQSPPRKAMFKTGWLRMWEQTVRVNNFKIELNTYIEKVDRQPDGKIIISGVQKEVAKRGEGEPLVVLSEKAYQEEFDYLVVAAPLYNQAKSGDAYETLAGVKNEVVPLKLDPKEAALLQSDTLTYSQFRTILFKLEDPKPYLFSHLEINSDKILGPDTGKADVFASRDSYLALNPEYCKPKGHIEDPLRGEKREQMAYQWVENDKDVPLSHFDEKFDEWAIGELGLKANGDAKNHYTVRTEKHWNYFQRYNREGLKNSNTWKVIDLQGASNTLFVHASTFFESVLDIVNYNNMIVDGLQGKLNDMMSPKQFKYSNAEVEAAGPPLKFLQKPFYYQTDHWKTFYNKYVKFLLTLLDFVLGFIWTVLYIPLRPILGFTVIRYQRYLLQKAFKTEDIGKWWQFSMKHFLKVSPSVLVYEHEAENLKNGNNELDTLDPVMKAAYPEMDKNYQDIPRVKKALMLSYADYRTVVRLWMEKINPNFLNFIDGWIQSSISWLSLNFPIIFNYFGSWGTAIGFNVLTGYSLRVEDDKGGGCFVPKCEMLYVARQEYGEEMGCRVCSHVCKIFTEEALKRKGIPMTLEPNYEDGSCMIRSVPVRTAAFHDHSVNNGMKITPKSKNPAAEV